MTRIGAAALAVMLSAAVAGCASTHRATAPVHRAKGVTRTAFSRTPAGQFWARQGRLDAAATYAERVAGATHVFGGDRVDDQANKVVLYLVRAPQSVIDELQKSRPDTYVIHNDAPRTWGSLRQVQRSLDFAAWKARGVNIVMSELTLNGYLDVGVNTNIAKAQAVASSASYTPSRSMAGAHAVGPA
jgi:hypothetical protein